MKLPPYTAAAVLVSAAFAVPAAATPGFVPLAERSGLIAISGILGETTGQTRRHLSGAKDMDKADEDAPQDTVQAEEDPPEDTAQVDKNLPSAGADDDVPDITILPECGPDVENPPPECDTLSEQLSETGGVIPPPPTPDDDIYVPAPEPTPGTTPVIPPSAIEDPPIPANPPED